MNILRTFSTLIFTAFLFSCAQQQGAVEDVSTGLYEKGGMTYLDKGMKVPAKIYFDYNSYLLTSMAEGTLDIQVTWMDENPSKYILIEGHCDERGTREYNLALGERRANAVKEYLSSMGIAPDRLNIVSYGKERPDVEGSFDDAWQKNRRSVTTLDVDR
ncbi:MAG: Outer membrane lipoprotein Omp16 [Alphaproteobacteria bacterium MarineAlpha6_Bin4]|nr:MAG: Outer membrane lipoprotein Omp16 [Alphaproteobacteria bacterium MarineAlpha6_Bin3]PPR38040.1 MAG: Outer membrane lipoprotein Omp16 [Alphaproteobacteria bacterium MarineAlpha6_Bin4]